MTYAELFEVLKTMKKTNFRFHMQMEVVFVDVDGNTRGVSHTEYNDGSIKGADTFQLLLMEV